MVIWILLQGNAGTGRICGPGGPTTLCRSRLLPLICSQKNVCSMLQIQEDGNSILFVFISWYIFLSSYLWHTHYSILCGPSHFFPFCSHVFWTVPVLYTYMCTVRTYHAFSLHYIDLFIRYCSFLMCHFFLPTFHLSFFLLIKLFISPIGNLQGLSLYGFSFIHYMWLYTDKVSERCYTDGESYRICKHLQMRTPVEKIEENIKSIWNRQSNKKIKANYADIIFLFLPIILLSIFLSLYVSYLCCCDASSCPGWGMSRAACAAASAYPSPAPPPP